MFRRSVTPLLIGTLLLRVSGGAATVVMGLFLVQLAHTTGGAITSLQVGILAVVYFATELSLAPLMGALGDRWGRRHFLIIGPLLGLLQVALIPFTPIAAPLLYLSSLQVVSGMSSAMTTPATLGYLADFTAHNAALRTRVMSFFELVTSGGIAIGVVAGGFAWERFGRAAFGLLACLYLLVIVCMLVAPKARQIIERAGVRVMARRYWRMLCTPRLFLFIPAWISLCALVGIWFSSQLPFILSNPVQGQHHQLLMGSMSGPSGAHNLSFVLGGYVLFFGLCLVFWAFFLGRVPRLLLMLTSIVGIYLCCVALFGLNHRGTNGAWLFVWILLLAVGIFAESSFAPAALTYLADVSEKAAKDRGLLMGLYSIFLGLGQLIGNGLGGVFARAWGFDGLIYLTTLLGAIALVALLVLYRQDRKAFDQPHQSASVDIDANVGVEADVHAMT
jgi:MFS family permease